MVRGREVSSWYLNLSWPITASSLPLLENGVRAREKTKSFLFGALVQHPPGCCPYSDEESASENATDVVVERRANVPLPRMSHMCSKGNSPPLGQCTDFVSLFLPGDPVENCGIPREVGPTAERSTQALLESTAPLCWIWLWSLWSKSVRQDATFHSLLKILIVIVLRNLSGKVFSHTAPISWVPESIRLWMSMR